MDLSTVVIIATFSFVNAGLDQTQLTELVNTSGLNSSESPQPVADNISSAHTTLDLTISTSSSVPVIGLTATWTKTCEDVQTQLQVYKVMTALLICVLLVLFLIRFTRPTVTALQKRLSDRRQHRWVGPTQSHSVSYHRGKTAAENSEEEKRLSYPALERLTIGGRSSPSCSRSNFYNF